LVCGAHFVALWTLGWSIHVLGAILTKCADVGNALSARSGLPPTRRQSSICHAFMEELKLLDEVAYIRFASVYRQFEDAAAFREAIETLESQPDPKTAASQLSLLAETEEPKTRK